MGGRGRARDTEGEEGRWAETIRDVQQMQMIVSSTAGTVPETGWADVHECCFVWKGFLDQKGVNVPSFSPVEGYTQYLERTVGDTHGKASRQRRDLSWA